MREKSLAMEVLSLLCVILECMHAATGKSLYGWQQISWYQAYTSPNYSSNHQIASQVFGKSRPCKKFQEHSYPFFTENTLRAWVDWNYVEYGTNVKLTPGTDKDGSEEQMKDGDSIFVRTDYITEFANMFDPVINKSYILITGNSDYPAPIISLANAKDLLESPRLIRWFAQNPGIVHPKLEAIPIGLPNSNLGQMGSPEVLSQTIFPEVPIYQPAKKEDRAIRPHLSSINIIPHTEIKQRTEALEKLSEISQKLVNVSPIQRAKQIKMSRFVICPAGLVGRDSHLTWSSVLLGAIPVVLHSAPLVGLYSQAPVLVVNDWEDVTENFLENFHVNTTSKDVLFVDYWLDKIDAIKQQQWIKQFNHT